MKGTNLVEYSHLTLRIIFHTIVYIYVYIVIFPILMYKVRLQCHTKSNSLRDTVSYSH